jgi:TRAP-type C4-dicarboxylate transport system permease small subunit
VRRALDALYALSGALAALCLAGVFVVMMVQAVGREFGLLIRGAIEVTCWLCAASAFFALAHTFRHGELVRVGLWLDFLKPTARWWAEIVALALTACFVGYMTWAIADYVYGGWRGNYVTQGLLKIPEWIPQVSLVLGSLIFLIAVLDELVTVLRKQKPSYQRAEEERRAAKDFSEMV